MVDYYLDAVREKFNDFIEENADSRLSDVHVELRELVNEIIKVTWESSAEETISSLRSS